MQKKVFLQKNPRRGGGRSPYVKYLLMAALGLMLLVLITPYLLNQKGRDSGRRTLTEKGMLRKDLPKPPETPPGEIPATAEKPPGATAEKPEAPQPSEPPKPSEPAAPGASVEPVPPALPPEQAQTAKQPEPAPRDLFPKKGSPAPAPAVTQKPPSTPPAAKKETKPSVAAAGIPAESAAAKQAMKDKAVPGAKGMYSVQVGSYKEKQGAEDVQRSLRKKGYDVVICPSKSGPNAYSVVTRPFPTMSKAATISEQIKGETKGSPTIIKAPAGCELPAREPKAAPEIDKKTLKPTAMKKPQDSQAKPPAKPVAKTAKPVKAPAGQKPAVPAEKRQPAPPNGN